MKRTQTAKSSRKAPGRRSSTATNGTPRPPAEKGGRGNGFSQQRGGARGDSRTSGSTRYRLVETTAGTAAFVGSERGLARMYLPSDDVAQLRRAVLRDYPAATEDSSLLPALARDLERYFAGEPVEFEVKFDWPGATAFQARIWNACLAIPYGGTLSYAELGEKAGAPGSARAVGMVMGANRCPIVVPCHRVLRSDGSIGGYSGPGGVEFKERLLEMESAGAAVR